MNQILHAYGKNLAVELDQLLDMNLLLREDIQILLEIFHHDWSHPTFQRTIVRSCWAHIEAIIHGIKRFTLRACELGSADLSSEDHLFLSEKEFFIESNGNINVKSSYEKTETNIKKTLNLAALHFSLPTKPDFNTQGWQQLKSSLALRHRVTHPKSTKDLTISDQEIENHKQAFLWFSKTFTEFLESLEAKHGKHNKT